MNNYEYIIASLPVLNKEALRDRDAVDADAVISSIMEQLSEKDKECAGLLLSGFDNDSLDYEFYLKTLAHNNRFIREYFKYDLDVRNTKVQYLNKALGRMNGVDMIVIESRTDEEFNDRSQVNTILALSDILKRERGLDDIMWNKVDELTTFDLFDIEYILGFMVRLKIVDRWLKLNPETGKELFRKLVGEIKSTYEKEKNKIDN